MGFWFPQSAFESLYLNHKRSRSFWAGFSVYFGIVVTLPVICKSLRINDISKTSLAKRDREISFYFLIIKNLQITGGTKKG